MLICSGASLAKSIIISVYNKFDHALNFLSLIHLSYKPNLIKIEIHDGL